MAPVSGVFTGGAGPVTAVRRPTVLVTGGAGFIGSHTCVALAQAGHDLVVLDNFSNSQPSVMGALAALCGPGLELVCGDVRDADALRRVFDRYRISAVIHFAALKAVEESVLNPLQYYENNLVGLLRLLEAMRHADVRTLVFSSSAAVYGAAETVPIRESAPLNAASPYGRTKLMCEQVLADLVDAEPYWRIARLRYFNPVGAHESGLIGEQPSGVPSNLMPYLMQVAAGLRPVLRVFGSDYPTPDGSGIRDYIHVMDLAEGHVAALAALQRADGMLTLNLGTGRGVSVLEMVDAFERACACRVPYELVARRPGDVAMCWADASRAERLIAWRARRDVRQMCVDGWRWQTKLNADLASPGAACAATAEAG